MAIQKQQFYEGAALHLIVRSGNVERIQTDPPFFVVNDVLLVHLKYCTKTRGPWAFTFAADEQLLLARRAQTQRLVLGLVCGGDGVAALSFDQYLEIAPTQSVAVRVACQRRPGQQYCVGGPAGDLSRKISPSAWQRLLFGEGHE